MNNNHFPIRHTRSDFAGASEQRQYNCQLLGMFGVRRQMSSLSKEEKMEVFRQCLAMSQQIGKQPTYENVTDALVPLSGNPVICSYSRLGGKCALLVVEENNLLVILNEENFKTVSIHCQNWLGLIRSQGDILVYIGHENSIHHCRMAVVLKMTDSSYAAKEVESYIQTRMGHSSAHAPLRPIPTAPINMGGGASMSPPFLNQHPQRGLPDKTPNIPPSPQPSETSSDSFSSGDSGQFSPIYEDDAFYSSYGFTSDVQEKLYFEEPEPERWSAGNNTQRKESKTTLERGTSMEIKRHLDHFFQSEIDYVKDLSNLSSLSVTFRGRRETPLSPFVDNIYKTHRKMDFQSLSRRDGISIEKVADIIVQHSSQLSVYIEFIAKTDEVEDALKLHFENQPSVKCNVVTIRTRLHSYFMNFESWLKLVSSESDKMKLMDAINVCKSIYKSCDTKLVLQAVTQCPFETNNLVPLLKQGTFKVQASKFKPKMNYKVLLFKKLLVILEPKGDKLLFFDAFDIEQIQVVKLTKEVSDKKSPVLKIEINYGKRRGKEILDLEGKNAIELRKHIDKLHQNIMDDARDAEGCELALYGEVSC